MKKVVFLLFTAVIFLGACDKTVKEQLQYSVVTSPESALEQNFYIIDSGVTYLPLEVRFLSGNTIDPVTISMAGIPANVTLAQDTFIEQPTFLANYTFTTNNAAVGVYPVTLTTSTPTASFQTYTIYMNIIPNDCASLFWGNLSCSNACSDRSYTFSCTGVDTHTKNNLTINNFGGYGVTVNVTVLFNGNSNALTIPLGNYGNGTVLQGSGYFTANSMVINYVATSTPTGVSETCTDTLKI